jgi:hypothetical protein
VYWKLDGFENSLRMRKRLKQNYKGADHQIPMIGCEQSRRTSSDGALPVASAMAKLITVNNSADDTGEEASRSGDEIEESGSSSRKEESNSSSEVVHSEIAQTQSSNTAAAAASPAPSPVAAAPSAPEATEVLILEMPGVLIQPLKLRGGMFQVGVLNFSLVQYNLILEDTDMLTPNNNCCHTILYDHMFVNQGRSLTFCWLKLL